MVARILGPGGSEGTPAKSKMIAGPVRIASPLAEVKTGPEILSVVES